MIDQLYKELTPELKKLNRIRLPYLFFNKLGAACIVLLLFLFCIYPILVQLIFSFQSSDKLLPNVLKWTSWLVTSPYLFTILILTAFFSPLPAAIFYKTISNIQQRIFSAITNAVCTDFTVIQRIISNQQLLDTGFFTNKLNKSSYTISKGTISGEIDGVNCELWDVNVFTNRYHQLMMIPGIGTIFALLYTFVTYFKALKKDDVYDQGFKGIIIKCDFDRPLYGWTIVLPNTWEQKVPFIKQVVQRLNDKKENDIVHLVDVNFAEKFIVYSSDQVEARYILSPEFIETIVKWQEQLKHPLLLSFNRYNMYLAILDHEGIFEIPLTHSALNLENIKKPFNDLKIFTKMIEDFKADKRIWHEGELI